MKKLFKIFIVLFFGTLVLCNRTYAKTFDSGVPLPKEYTKELVSSHIGQNVTVFYTNDNKDDRITLQVLGVLWDRFKKKDKYLLLGYTEFKNRVVIPIEKIYLIEENK